MAELSGERRGWEGTRGRVLGRKGSWLLEEEGASLRVLEVNAPASEGYWARGTSAEQPFALASSRGAAGGILSEGPAVPRVGKPLPGAFLQETNASEHSAVAPCAGAEPGAATGSRGFWVHLWDKFPSPLRVVVQWGFGQLGLPAAIPCRARAPPRAPLALGRGCKGMLPETAAPGGRRSPGHCGQGWVLVSLAESALSM